MTCVSLTQTSHFFPATITNAAAAPATTKLTACAKFPKFRFDPVQWRSFHCKMSTQESSSTYVVQQNRIIVQNSHGEKLVGIFHDAGSKKLAILCHGFRSSKDSNVNLSLVDPLTGEGISVFRFDFSGNGESEGLFYYGHYKREAEDLRAVVQYFSERGHEISAIVGHSKGGDVVLLYASKYDDISTVINISGRFDLSKGVVERLGEDFMEKIKKDGFINVKERRGNDEYQVTEESLMDRLNTDMPTAVMSINRSCRVLTIHGSEDEVIAVEDALEFDKRIPNHKLVIVKGANHCYTSHQSHLGPIVVDFIKDSSFQTEVTTGEDQA